jgi:hypothetical protein
MNTKEQMKSHDSSKYIHEIDRKNYMILNPEAYHSPLYSKDFTRLQSH